MIYILMFILATTKPCHADSLGWDNALYATFMAVFLLLGYRMQERNSRLMFRRKIRLRQLNAIDQVPSCANQRDQSFELSAICSLKLMLSMWLLCANGSNRTLQRQKGGRHFMSPHFRIPSDQHHLVGCDFSGMRFHRLICSWALRSCNQPRCS